LRTSPSARQRPVGGIAGLKLLSPPFQPNPPTPNVL
jgi:hypothetical protein